MSQALTTCLIEGVAPASPLFRVLVKEIQGRAMLTGSDRIGADPILWALLSARTDLFWRNSTALVRGPETVAVESATDAVDVTVDLWGAGGDRTGPGRRWRIVDSAGRPALAPLAWADRVFQAPYYLSVLVVEDTAEGCVVVADAHLSSRTTYSEVLSAAARGIGAALARALQCADGSLRPFHPEVEPSIPRPLALARGAVERVAAKWHRRLFRETWAIASGTIDPACLVAPRRDARVRATTMFGTLRWTEAESRNSYIADPFFWPGRPGVRLFENFSYETNLGTIQASVEGHPGTSEVSFGFDCHLSYPYVWSEGDDVFCIPESGASRCSRIFRLREDRAPECVAIVTQDRPLADPTVFKRDGFYWIAFTDTDLGLHDNLCLLMSGTLEGPWLPHPHNPVKTDIRSARPGGTPFVVDGILYRPAQDCAAGYGAALTINRVLRCDPSGYAEEPVLTILPDRGGPYSAGLHTLSLDRDGPAFLIDGKTYRFDVRGFLAKLLARRR